MSSHIQLHAFLSSSRWTVLRHFSYNSLGGPEEASNHSPGAVASLITHSCIGFSSFSASFFLSLTPTHWITFPNKVFALEPLSQDLPSGRPRLRPCYFSANGVLVSRLSSPSLIPFLFSLCEFPFSYYDHKMIKGLLLSLLWM